MNFILYIFVFVYYIESIYTVQKAKADSILVEFFPIYYFIIPCMIGTMIQGFFFRISMVWLCVAIAFILVYIEIQISISFIDDLSGLYNRKYMNHYLNKLQNNKTKHVYGFMMVLSMTLKPSMIHTDIKKVIMPSYILVKFYVIRLIKIQLPFVWVEMNS